MFVNISRLSGQKSGSIEKQSESQKSLDAITKTNTPGTRSMVTYARGVTAVTAGTNLAPSDVDSSNNGSHKHKKQKIKDEVAETTPGPEILTRNQIVNSTTPKPESNRNTRTPGGPTPGATPKETSSRTKGQTHGQLKKFQTADSKTATPGKRQRKSKRSTRQTPADGSTPITPENKTRKSRKSRRQTPVADSKISEHPSEEFDNQKSSLTVSSQRVSDKQFNQSMASYRSAASRASRASVNRAYARLSDESCVSKASAASKVSKASNLGAFLALPKDQIEKAANAQKELERRQSKIAERMESQRSARSKAKASGRKLNKDEEQLLQFETILNKKKDQNVKKMKKGLGQALRANILGKLGMTEQTYKDQQQKEEDIRQKILHGSVPAKIKQTLNLADAACGEFVKANKVTQMMDFGSGYYFAEPRDARGVDLERDGRDRLARPENQHLYADGVANESHGNTILNASKFSNEIPKLKTLSGSNFEHLDASHKSESINFQRDKKRLDIREMNVHGMSKGQYDMHTKKQADKGVEIREKIKEMRRQENQDRQTYLMQKYKKKMRKPPLAPQVSAGPASQAANVSNSQMISPQSSHIRSHGQLGINSVSRQTDQSKASEQPQDHPLTRLGIPGMRTYLNKNSQLSTSVSQGNLQNETQFFDRRSMQSQSQQNISRGRQAFEFFDEFEASNSLPKIRLGPPKKEQLPTHLSNDKRSKVKVRFGDEKKELPPMQQKIRDLIQGNKKVVAKTQHREQYTDAVMLIKPGIDSSEKELYMRNGFKSAETNLQDFLVEKDAQQVMDKMFKPQKLGEFGLDNRGTKINLTNQRAEVDYQRDNAVYAAAADEFDLMTAEKQRELIAKEKILLEKERKEAERRERQRNWHRLAIRDKRRDKEQIFTNEAPKVYMVNQTENTEEDQPAGEEEEEEEEEIEPKPKPDGHNVFHNNKESEYADMRLLIRELGENGEKFEIEDRSFGKDYVEDFEADSQDEADEIYSEESEGKSDQSSPFKTSKLRQLTLDPNNRAESLQLLRSKSRLTLPAKINLKTSSAGKLERTAIENIGIEDNFEEKTAYGKKEHEEMLAAQFEQDALKYVKKENEEQKFKSMINERLQQKLMEQLHSKKGMALEKESFATHDNLSSLFVIGKNGKKVGAFRYIDTEKARIERDDNHINQKEYERAIRENRNKRLEHHIRGKGAKIQNPFEDYVYKMNIIRDEIEGNLIGKYGLKPEQKFKKKEEVNIQQVKKQALVDNVLMENKNYTKSLATNKILWKGEGGAFAKRDLVCLAVCKL